MASTKNEIEENSKTTPAEEERKILAARFYAQALASLRQSGFAGVEKALEMSIKSYRTNKSVQLLKRVKAQTAAGKDRDVPPWVYRWCCLPVTLVLIGFSSLLGVKSTWIAAPIACISCLFLTVTTAYYLWFPLREPGIYFPAISALGVAHPQKLVYQFGFVAVGITLATHIYVVRENLINQHLLNDNDIRRQKIANDCIWYGFLAAIGAGLQGLFTLEMKLSPKSFVHWGSAVMFMMGAMNHSQLSQQLYTEAKEHSELLHVPLVVQITTFRTALLKYSSFIMFAPMIISQIFFASTPKQRTEDVNPDIQPPSQPGTMNAMGLMQWCIILQFSFYFLSYAVDLWCAAGLL